jgi:hypothetical protein
MCIIVSQRTVSTKLWTHLSQILNNTVSDTKISVKCDGKARPEAFTATECNGVFSSYQGSYVLTGRQYICVSSTHLPRFISLTMLVSANLT